MDRSSTLFIGALTFVSILTVFALSTPVTFSALLRRLDEAVINALNNGGPWDQVDRLQDELVACNDCTWNMQQVDYYIRQTHYK